ncbi:MAG: hypothetical protein WCK29_04410, partial [archaeon]
LLSGFNYNYIDNYKRIRLYNIPITGITNIFKPYTYVYASDGVSTGKTLVYNVFDNVSILRPISVNSKAEVDSNSHVNATENLLTIISIYTEDNDLFIPLSQKSFYDEIEKQKVNFEEEVNSKRVEISRVQKDNDEAVNQISKLKIKEIPISYSKRIGKSKLKSFSDGWKHLRFMLLYSPLFLFLIPGLLMLFLGLESMVWLYFGNVELFGVRFYFHPLFVSSLFIILGYQLVIFSIFAKIYAITHLKEKSQFFDILFRYITIEKASIFGSICAAFGILVFIYIFLEWINSGLSSLNEIKNALVAMTFTIIGFQTIFSSFMLSILGIKEK